MYIAIDIGGTTARVAGFDSLTARRPGRKVSYKITGAYPEDRGALITTMQDLAGRHTVKGIGLAIPGSFDSRMKKLIDNSNLHGWVGYPIASDLARPFSCPVVLRNDTEAAALGEAASGHRRRPFWFITWGTGIGGCLVYWQDRTPVVSGGRVGHHILAWGDRGPACGRGHHGCLESFIGGRALERRYGRPARRLNTKQWAEASDWMARGLYNLAKVFPTDRIVFGGGIMSKQAKRLPVVEASLYRYLEGFSRPKLSLASHGEDAGLFGALALLR